MMINCPQVFDYDECLVYMKRSSLESTHYFIGNTYRKIFKIENQLYLVEVIYKNYQLHMTCLNSQISEHVADKIKEQIRFIFDLDFDLNQFYNAPVDDEIKALYKAHGGLRLIHMDNFYEGLIWAVLGQQINLKFAYTLKKRLVEAYGKFILYENVRYYYFPEPEIMMDLTVDILRSYQITKRKSEYIIGISKLYFEGYFDVPEEQLYDRLMSVRGIGEWTANYVLMKCFQKYDTLPASDAGVMNALKTIYDLENKPTKDEVIEIFRLWDYKGYITFYLWRSLYV